MIALAAGVVGGLVAVAAGNVFLLAVGWLGAALVAGSRPRPGDPAPAWAFLGDALAVAALGAVSVDAQDPSLPWAGGAPLEPWAAGLFGAGLALRVVVLGARDPVPAAVGALVAWRVVTVGTPPGSGWLVALAVLALGLAWVGLRSGALVLLGVGAWAVGHPTTATAAALLTAGAVAAGGVGGFRGEAPVTWWERWRGRWTRGSRRGTRRGRRRRGARRGRRWRPLTSWLPRFRVPQWRVVLSRWRVVLSRWRVVLSRWGPAPPEPGGGAGAVVTAAALAVVLHHPPGAGDLTVVATLVGLLALLVSPVGGGERRPRPRPSRAVGVAATLTAGVLATAALAPGFWSGLLDLPETGVGDTFVDVAGRARPGLLAAAAFGAAGTGVVLGASRLRARDRRRAA